MTLSLEEVEYIAELARLQLSQVEKERFRQQLSAILDYIRKLQELNTTDIPPTSSVLSEASPLRADESRPGLSREALFENAPEVERGQFKIPPVFE